MKTNIYKFILNDWYFNRFNNVKEFQKSLNSQSTSNVTFTKDLRTLSINLGRIQGATTALVEFVKEHLDLNILIIYPAAAHKANFLNIYNDTSHIPLPDNIKIISSKSNECRGLSTNNIDIIFIDIASYINYENIQPLLDNLNIYNANQWIIKLG